MKKLFALTFSLLFIIFYILYLNRFSFRSDYLLVSNDEHHYYDYRGLTNVHSILSTGSSSPSEIIQFAQTTQADFLFFTEVNLYEDVSPFEGYFGPLLVLNGGEYSYLDSRLLYYNRPKAQPPSRQGMAQVYFTDLLAKRDRPKEDGYLVLAHPLNDRYPWSGDYPPGLNGIEVINLKQILDMAWKESKISTLWSIFLLPVNPRLAFIRIFETPQKELNLWDDLNAKQKTLGFFGTDATAKITFSKDSSIKFPSYDTLFNIGSNHVLLNSEFTGQFEKDKKKLLEALFKGQFYFSLDILSDPKGFWTEARSKGKVYPLGSEIPNASDAKIHIHLPSVHYPTEIRIYKNGKLEDKSDKKTYLYKIKSKGIYRAVVELKVEFPFPEKDRWIPWIYTNYYYVR